MEREKELESALQDVRAYLITMTTMKYPKVADTVQNKTLKNMAIETIDKALCKVS